MREKKVAKSSDALDERFYVASQYQLMWWKFRKHKLAMVGMVILFIFYMAVIFCEFLSPYNPNERHTNYLYTPPQRVHFFDEKGFCFSPFVYKITFKFDPETWERVYSVDKKKRIPIFFLVHGEKYKFWNLLRANVHLFGVKEGSIFLLGTDSLGRDVFSRIIYGTRISLSIGLIAVFISFVLGLVLGGISGYYGGMADIFIQRVIEFLFSLPIIPIWMALTAALPGDWSPLKVYFAITLIFALVQWTTVARVVRGKLLSLRKEDFITAAKIAGASNWLVIIRHLLPSSLSYIIVSLTLAVPQMILAETSLSFLGVGLRPPVVSWGVMLTEAQDIHKIANYPWVLLPGIFVVIAILGFNFVGDGLRDAADPYK